MNKKFAQDQFFKIHWLIDWLIFWLRWVFVAVHGLSLVAESRGYSSLRCTGFSLRWPPLLWSMGSRRAGFSSCGSRAQLLRGMWDLPRPGLEPMSPALAGRFSTTALPGKPLTIFLMLYIISPWLTHFTTGGLYLLIPFTDFAPFHTLASGE